MLGFIFVFVSSLFPQIVQAQGMEKGKDPDTPAGGPSPPTGSFSSSEVNLQGLTAEQTQTQSKLVLLTCN
jgi:hypothetical protein